MIAVAGVMPIFRTSSSGEQKVLIEVADPKGAPTAHAVTFKSSGK
jgi:hypothetical protein